MKKCKFKKCDRNSISREYCHKHFKRYLRGTLINKCKICNNVLIETGHHQSYCKEHFYKKCKLCNKPFKAKMIKIKFCSQLCGSRASLKDILRRRTLKEGAKRTTKGYIYMKNKGLWVREHRLIMENRIGRRLLKEESVHHKNGIKTDNRISNLELWSNSHPSGQRVKDKLAWAEEIIQLYDNPCWGYQSTFSCHPFLCSNHCFSLP